VWWFINLSFRYRIFADTIDEAILAGYKIPLPTDYLNSTTAPPGSPLMNATANSGLNPGSIMQHPGFYYHLAAMCCAERRRRYLEAERADASSPVLQKEKLVDHSNLTIELLTKSYEQFKRYRNGRMTLYLAAEIAGTYYETGKFEMALKFFERIGKTYRKEKWHMVLTSILRWSLRCAKELVNFEKAVECLVELMSDELPMTETKRRDIQKELFDTLTNQPSQAPLVISMDQINAFIACQVQIKHQTNFVGAPVEYQILLKANKGSPLDAFRFNALKVVFNDARYNVVLRDDGSTTNEKPVELIDFSKDVTKITEEGNCLGWDTANVDLTMCKNQVKVFQGLVIPQECGELKVVSVSLDIITDNWEVELNYDIDKLVDEAPVTRRKWLEYTSGKTYCIRRGFFFIKTLVFRRETCVQDP
jgi:hypothetical protein